MRLILFIQAAMAGLGVLASAPLLADSLPVPLDAKVVDQRPALVQERVYPLGGLRKISNQLRVEGKIESRGQVSSTTYELPRERSANEAFTAAREALQKDGGYPLFWCQARDCGENSLWANEVFKNRLLSGADEQQAFILLRRSAEQNNTLVALYSITRGNKRAYLHVEEFVADAPLGELLPTPATLMRELLDTGKLDYPDLDGEPPEAWINLLGRSLNNSTTLRVSLSGAKAEAWREQLVKAGVRPARLEVGQAETDGFHVELIR
ncbi:MULTISPECIES: DUF4892 domain-containing protein [Pseudomonas]|uniref:DUF4892 domain-containing protein n=1 Tax=Pseudomonas donghuensis TaxID=1163398 RepID=A0AAP0SJA5_9PSED|nr:MULTISPECIES: DUF4892 domain-containing protein [Pseudomonas]MDF9892643.1 hypothetical protein [Pseudomonas vranovensis]KDO01200.2 DUF4892 domain-containing protein [Pseudomonas donghuensis]MBF4207764.1 DUF4892 domain-containing protein [Pseudomonas donghuensis]MBS7600302.1 DUF4892 domain-containing protein [Pseudomonas sp. RC2C2]MCP3750890.1 DUF4892 domain-containing protein [Pseudomonas sp. SBB6]